MLNASTIARHLRRLRGHIGESGKIPDVWYGVRTVYSVVYSVQCTVYYVYIYTPYPALLLLYLCINDNNLLIVQLSDFCVRSCPTVMV